MCPQCLFAGCLLGRDAGQAPTRALRTRGPFPSPTGAAVSRVHAWAWGRVVPRGCRAGLLLGGAAVPHGWAPSPQAPILWAAEGCGLRCWGAGVLPKKLEPGWVFSTAQLPSEPYLCPRLLSGSETQRKQTQTQGRPREEEPLSSPSHPSPSSWASSLGSLPPSGPLLSHPITPLLLCSQWPSR